MQRASALSLASLWTLLGTTTACQDLTGKCSSRTDTLCLQIEVASPTPIPDDVTLTLSAAAQKHTYDFPNLAAQLAARPYVVEVAFDTTAPAALTVDAVGNISDPATQALRQVAAASLTIMSPTTAARPTRIVLQATGGGDLGLPTGDMSSGTPTDGGGANGTVYQYSGGTWTAISSSALNGYTITALWGDGAGSLWAAATNGTDGAIFKH